MRRIRRGEKYPHRNDGEVYRNLPNKKTDEIYLPIKEKGYYKEYVHPTPNWDKPGSRRIIKGKGGELYYSPDHYDTFLKFKRK